MLLADRDLKFRASHPLRPYFCGEIETSRLKFQARSNISIEIENFERDQVFLIVGPSGSGMPRFVPICSVFFRFVPIKAFRTNQNKSGKPLSADPFCKSPRVFPPYGETCTVDHREAACVLANASNKTHQAILIVLREPGQTRTSQADGSLPCTSSFYVQISVP